MEVQASKAIFKEQGRYGFFRHFVLQRILFIACLKLREGD